MKLSQPASSSDIEAAREIARRLNQHRRRDDRSGAAPSPAVEPASADEALAPPKRLRPPPVPPRLAQRRPEPVEPPAFEPPEVDVEEPEAPPEPRPTPPPRPMPARLEAPPAPRVEAPPPAPRFEAAPAPRPAPPPPRVEIPAEPTGEFEAEFDPEEPPAFERTASSEDEEDDPLQLGDDSEVEIPEPEEDEPLGALTAAADAPVFRAPADDPALTPDDSGVGLDMDVEDASLSPEELVGGSVDAAEASPLDQLTEAAERSPFDDALLDEPGAGDEPVGPSWDDIVETCRELAQANGAMLVDPAGQVFAARGDWPTPGPHAIATKLVAMMEKTLKDAPTRSISAPLMGLHLTAWRVQLNEGLVTIAFIGRTPVKTEARPAIDNEIHRGTGA